MKKKSSSSKFKSKPDYNLYNKLWYTLDTYLITRIDSYIFFKYYNLDIFNLIKELSMKEFLVLNAIYEYDYKVFKTLLFLYWDLEFYLGCIDDVKYSLKTVLDNYNCLSIQFNKKIKSYEAFLELIKVRKPINLWYNLENRGMFDKILKYDVYSKLDSLDTKYKDVPYISKYKKYNDLMSEGALSVFMNVQSSSEFINSLYYGSYIEEWYKEWSAELNQDLTLKYKSKIKILDLELRSFLSVIEKF